MKRNIITIMMALAALLMAQCKKQTEQQANEPATPTMEVKVRVENATSKTEITPTGVASWKQGDKLYVVGGDQGLLGYVSAKADGDPATFSGSITALTSAQTLRFYYVGDKSFTLDGDNYTFDLGSQDGSLAGIAAHNQLAFGKTTGTIAVGAIDFGTITMTSLMSIARLNINDGGNAVSGPVTVTGGFATSTFNAKTYDGSALTGTAGDITMTFASGTTSTDCYLALLPGAQMLKFSADGKEATLAEKAVAPNMFYNASSAIAVTVTPKPKFTVDANGTKVVFAPGNLWADATDAENPVFYFEANQWDYCMNDIHEDEWGDLFGTWDPSHVSHFKWCNAKNAVSDDYVYSGNLFCNENFTVAGDSHNDWRTLSYDEWNYLLSINPDAAEQQEDYGREDALRLSMWSTVTFGESGPTVSGLIIMPDGYDFSTTPLTDGDGTTSYERWQALEASGAVFLPGAGSREGTDVSIFGSSGCYWSSTRYEDDVADAYNLNFGSSYVGTLNNNRYIGFSFRLVR